MNYLILSFFLILPYYTSAQEICLEIRKNLASLYDHPNERAIDEARRDIKSKLLPTSDVTKGPECLRNLRESSLVNEKCVRTLSTRDVDRNAPLPCPAQFDDAPMLNYAVRGIIKNNETLSSAVDNTEKLLDPDRRCPLYKALSKETLRGDIKTIQNLHRSILSNLVNPYLTDEQTKSLKEAVRTLALKTMMHKVEGEYQPGFMMDLTKVCNFTAANAVRDAIVDIARSEGTGARLNEIVQPILKVHSHLSTQDLIYPFGMLIGYSTDFIKKSQNYGRLDSKIKDQIEQIQNETPEFYNKLFSQGEFCQSAVSGSTMEESSAWKQDLYIRNKGNFKNPQYSWYNWTDTTSGQFLMVGNSDLRMVLPDQLYDFKRTMFEKSERKIGTFKEVQPDFCGKRFKTCGKMMSLPLDCMMDVHRKKEGTEKNYFDVLGLQTDGNCPR